MNIFAAESDWTGPAFELFGTVHLIGLLLIALFIAAVIMFGRRSGEKTRKVIRYSLAALLVVAESSYHIWFIAHGMWTVSQMLPLHLCSILIWLSVPMLLTRNRYISEMAYLLGVAGALQALLTPDAGIYGFPHFRFVQTLASHCLLITSALYMVLVEGFQPTWSSVKRVVIGYNAYAGFVFVMNFVLQSNYLFIRHKPLTASLIDVMPAWPWYLIHLEILALVFVFLSFAPFAILDWRKRKLVEAGA